MSTENSKAAVILARCAILGPATAVFRIMEDFTILRTLPVHVDILLLGNRFKHFKRPVKKIFDLTKAGNLFSLRRGHYLNLISDNYRTVSLECLANELFGPSYVSLEWALQYYGLIPERVQKVTSVTTRPDWSVETPIGTFSYEHLNKNRYPYGYSVTAESNGEFFIASPAKAILDLISVRMSSVKWEKDFNREEFLREDLRLDLDRFIEMTSRDLLLELSTAYHRNSKEARLLSWLLRYMENRL